MKLAVVGAGIAGLAAARKATRRGLSAVLFDTAGAYVAQRVTDER